MKMKKGLYETILGVINNHKGLTIHGFEMLQKLFPDLSHDVLYSIYEYQYQKRMKLNYNRSRTAMNLYWDLYRKSVEKKEAPGIIIRMAERDDIAPCLVAKLIIRKYFEKSKSTENMEKLNANIYLRDTSLMPDGDLAYELYLCTIIDNMYSPLTDLMKASLGQEYEIKLYKKAKALDLAFRDEEDLRRDGYDKTPDLKLEVPIAVDGHVVTWIESKALFGNEENHKDYMKNQYLSYWNRFGPGLVIYWFGYLESIVDPNDNRFIVRDDMPTEIIRYIDILEAQFSEDS